MQEHVQQLYHMAGDDSHPWAASRAAMAVALFEQYQGGGLDSSEYQELMQDLVRSDRLDAEADDLDTKTMLVTAVFAVAQVI
jgi:hypothetical protein